MHTSPADDPGTPSPTDIAYLGRLPRPDGQGSFLVIAGVHAVGSLGVAHFLSENVADLYKQVGTVSFSMVIAADYDPSAKAISSSRALSDVLMHETA